MVGGTGLEPVTSAPTNQIGRLEVDKLEQFSFQELCAIMLFKRQIAVTIMGIGFALLLVSFIYYAYIFWFSGSDLKSLSATSQDKAATLLSIELMKVPEKNPDNITLIANQGLYPGSFMPPRLWADPRGTRELGQDSLAKEFIHL